MPGASKEETSERTFCTNDDESLQSIMQRLKKSQQKKHGLFSHVKPPNDLSVKDDRRISKKKGIVENATDPKIKSLKKRTSPSSPKDNPMKVTVNDNKKLGDSDENPQKIKRRRRKKKRKANVEIDEASRLQRRTRYLLIKLKLEQNLIDAYCADGWRGQSREKIKPEKELQRARKQILNCKLGIREAIHQLDLLSSKGNTDDSVHHEHMLCSICNQHEAKPDDDVIHCDGTCKCAFHRNCLDSPLRPQNKDESWFCKFCKKRIEILEATNAHLGTNFPVDINWQDVFKEEAALPDDENLMLHPEEWPSDDSEDENYDPEGTGPSCSSSSSSCSESYASDCSSNFRLGFLEEDDETGNEEVVSGPRQRAAVDYIKLNDEMFGKNAAENEQISDDEDWGPKAMRRRVRESDAADTLMTLGESENKNTEVESLEGKESLSKKTKKSINRLPSDSVEKLRLAFAENELPAIDVRMSLSQQLGLEFDKVNKWFKNARYLALKARKAERGKQSEDVDLMDETASKNNEESEEKLSKFVKRMNRDAPNNSIKKQMKTSRQRADTSKILLEHGDDDVSLKHLKEKAKEAKKKSNHEKRVVLSNQAEVEMKRLCEIKNRVENLRQILLHLPKCRTSKCDSARMVDDSNDHRSVMYIPIAELREKS